MTLFYNSTSNENNFIYSSRKHQRGRRNTVFVVVESHSILYSRKIVCLQVDLFTRYNGIIIEHLRSGANIGVHLKLLFFVNYQTTIAFRTILSLHFHHFWVCHTAHHIVPPHMWARHIVRNVGPPHLGFHFSIGPPTYHSLQGYL